MSSQEKLDYSMRLEAAREKVAIERDLGLHQAREPMHWFTLLAVLVFVVAASPFILWMVQQFMVGVQRGGVR